MVLWWMLYASTFPALPTSASLRKFRRMCLSSQFITSSPRITTSLKSPSQSDRHFWELLAATLDEQPEYQKNLPGSLLGGCIVPGSDHCQMVVTGLINKFFATAILSARALQRKAISKKSAGKETFDSSPDGALLVAAVTASIRLQLLPTSVSCEGGIKLGQNLDRVPLLVAAASAVLEEAELTESRLTASGIMQLLRSLSLYGYGRSVLAMIQSKDALYTGVSLSNRYRTLSSIDDEAADLLEGLTSSCILKGISLALKDLGSQHSKLYQNGKGSAEALEFRKLEVDALHHIVEVLEIPPDLMYSLTETDSSSQAEFLGRAYQFLSIANAIVGDRLLICESYTNLNQVLHEVVLQCAALAAAEGDAGASLSWTTRKIQSLAANVVCCISEAIHGSETDKINDSRVRDQGQNTEDVKSCEKLLLELIPTVMPVLKMRMTDNMGVDNEENLNSSSSIGNRGFATIAAHQMFWCLKQVKHPHLGPLCYVVMPCVLTAFHHYSPDVKRQATKTFIHLANNSNPSELRWYKDVILDAVSKNIICDGKLWPLMVKMSVELVTCLEGRNPRGNWYSCILNEMLGQLERQRNDSKFCTVWLQHIGKQFEFMGLILIAHFKRLLPLLFGWLHVLDDNVRLLVLKLLRTIIKHTWPRIPFHAERFWGELVLVYQESWNRTSGLKIRDATVEVCVLLKLCGGSAFEAAMQKSQDDPTVETLFF